MGAYSLTGAAVLGFFFLMTLTQAQVEVSRSVEQTHITAGGVVTVTLTLSVAGNQKGIVITENVPSGWTISSASPPVGKTVGNQAKWLLNSKTGVTSQLLSYVVNVPSSATGSFGITGSWESIDGNGQKHQGGSGSGTIEVPSSQISSTSTAPGTGGVSQPPPPFVQTVPQTSGQENTTAEQTCTDSRRCEGKNLMTCSGGKWRIIQECDVGCDEGTCIEGKDNQSTPLPPPKGIETTGGFLSGQGFLIAGILSIIAIGLLALRLRPKPAAFRYEFRQRA